MGDDIVTDLRNLYATYGPMDKRMLAIWKAADEIGWLRAVIDSLLADIDTDHRPVWAGGAKATGKQPWCCALCGVIDGEWPCTHRRALDKLKEARRG